MKSPLLTGRNGQSDAGIIALAENGFTALDAVRFTVLSDALHAQNVQAGWWKDPHTGDPKDRNVGELLMLIVSEVAEAMEGHRKGLMDDKLPHRLMIEVELADTVIRIFDLAGALELDVGGAILEKIAFNMQREDHKAENRVKPGGKAY